MVSVEILPTCDFLCSIKQELFNIYLKEEKVFLNWKKLNSCISRYLSIFISFLSGVKAQYIQANIFLCEGWFYQGLSFEFSGAPYFIYLSSYDLGCLIHCYFIITALLSWSLIFCFYSPQPGIGKLTFIVTICDRDKKKEIS